MPSAPSPKRASEQQLPLSAHEFGQLGGREACGGSSLADGLSTACLTRVIKPRGPMPQLGDLLHPTTRSLPGEPAQD